MKPELKDALAAKLLAMADDEIILGHRNSEWCGHAPILEEDIAFANIALDEIGHAAVWYKLLADLIGENRESYPDQMVFRRDAADFRPAQFVALPKGDWAFTMLRQYLFDVLETLRAERLAESQYVPLAEAMAKIRREEIYHLRHTRAWVKRLGLGTEESHRRMQNALHQLWPYTGQLFTPVAGESLLMEAGYFTDPVELSEAWQNTVEVHLRDSGLSVPYDVQPIAVNRDEQMQDLFDLVEEMQEVVRQYPNASW